MTQPLFEVIQVWKTKSHVFAGIEIKGEYQEIKLPRDEFEQWLEDANRLTFTEDIWNEDHTDITGERKGIWDVLDYWEFNNGVSIASDIYDFVVTTKTGFENLMQSVYEGMEETIKDFSPSE